MRPDLLKTGRKEFSKIHLASLFILLLKNFPFSDAGGWLKLCSENLSDTFLLEAGQCPHGVKLSQPRPINCVCATGVWILSNGECDPTAHILTGNGHCWNLNGVMKSEFKYLGRPSTPFSPATYIGTEWVNAFWKLPSGSKTSRDIIDIPRMTIISIFNKEKVISGRHTACCSRDPENKDLPVHICSGAPSGDYMLRSTCHPDDSRMVDLQKIGLAFGQGLHLGGEGIIQATAECSKCAQNRHYKFNTGCCQAVAWEDDDDFELVDSKRYDKQTNRFVGTHLDFILRNKRSFTLDTFEYMQMRYASGIFAKVCPEDGVPKDLLKVFLRFFRQAVNESLQTFPMEKTMDSIQNERIMAALEKCMRNAKAPWELQRSGTCDNPIIKMKSDTSNFTEVMTPEFQKFDSERFDLVMETSWKLIQFLHYFCAPEFEENPFDASFLVTGLERFYNTDLTRRWSNPGKSYEVFKFLLPTYDILKYMETMDACVAFAKKNSGGKKPWLVRPFLRRRKVNRRSEPIWNGTATCLTSYWWPDNSYSNKCGRNEKSFLFTNALR